MDRALLERMIGAVVLVLLFVVFVPALLDGRDADEVAVERVPGEDTRTAVIVLNAPRDENLPQDDGPEAEAALVSLPVPKPAPSVAKAAPKAAPAPASKPVAKPAPKPVAKTVSKPQGKAPPSEGFAVQLGSFGSRENAVGFASGLSKKGYPVFVVRGTAGSNEVYRVYAGPRPSRPEAETLADKLKRDGQSVLVVDLEARAGG